MFLFILGINIFNFHSEPSAVFVAHMPENLLYHVQRAFKRLYIEQLKERNFRDQLRHHCLVIYQQNSLVVVVGSHSR